MSPTFFWNSRPESESQPAPSAMAFRLSICDRISAAVLPSCLPSWATSYALPGIMSLSVGRALCHSEVVQPRALLPGT